MEPTALCRAVESYLRRKNDGHLIRIVGPAFEMVCEWAAAGIPLRVVERAIDRRYVRYYARGPKRHPLRIEYCEADVLDLFDDWKRAVGVGTAGRSGAGSESEAAGGEAVPRRGRSEGRRSLAGHLDDLAARLSTWNPPPGAAALERLVVEARGTLDAARAGGRTLRGEARRRLMEQLRELDARLPGAARLDAGDAVLGELRSEARGSLEPFRVRMPAPEFSKALEAATDRLLVDRFKLPRLTFD
jgi:hypothetical protein